MDNIWIGCQVCRFLVSISHLIGLCEAQYSSPLPNLSCDFDTYYEEYCPIPFIWDKYYFLFLHFRSTASEKQLIRGMVLLPLIIILFQFLCYNTKQIILYLVNNLIKIYYISLHGKKKKKKEKVKEKRNLSLSFKAIHQCFFWLSFCNSSLRYGRVYFIAPPLHASDGMMSHLLILRLCTIGLLIQS